MNTESNPRQMCLAKDRSLSLIDAKGARVRCRDGAVWITQDHDLRDIVLAPGESFTFDRDGRVIVSALVGSSVELRSAPPRGTDDTVHQDELPPRWLRSLPPEGARQCLRATGRH